MTLRDLLLTTTAIAAIGLAAAPAHADGGEAPKGYREKQDKELPPPPPPVKPAPKQEIRGGYDDCHGGRVCEGGQGSGWYISVLGGGNWTEDKTNYAFAIDTGVPLGAVYAYQDHKADTGFIVGGAIGYDLCCWLPGLRIEGEATYRRNKVKGYHEAGTDTAGSAAATPYLTGPLEGHISSFALMANVWYDIDLGGWVKPYIGGGIGWAQNRFKANYFDALPTVTVGFGSVDETDSGFAYQLGAGLNFAVSRGVSLGVGYRYADLGEMRFHMPATNSLAAPWVDPLVNTVKFDQIHQSATINLTFAID